MINNNFWMKLIVHLMVYILVTHAVPTLWPIPQLFTNGTETVELCNYNNIKIESNLPSSTILNNATDRFLVYLKNAPTSFTKKPMYKRNKSSNQCLSQILVHINSSDTELSITTNENYTLSINSTMVYIQSGTVYGSVYAFVTLSQLIRSTSNNANSTNIIQNCPWIISDYPAFKHRGLMIDTSRHYLSVELIKNTLFAMSLNKMNVLHWHMIDAQSFPFYSKSHPELSEYGSYGHNKTYFPDDIANIVTHATNLAIRIIPEWESPGHNTAIGFGDPQVMICDSLQDNRPNGDNPVCYEPPCGYMNVLNATAKQKAINLMNDIFMDSFNSFPDNYFHIGGDEVLDVCWGNNTDELYYEWMLNRIQFLIKHNKIPIMWNSDVNLMSDYGQNTNEIVMCTAGDNKYIALKNGFKVIDIDTNYYYLDCGQGSWQNPMGNFYCQPYHGWGVIYNHSVYDFIPNNATQQMLKNVIGGQIQQWGETVDDANFETRLWIRGAAAAERWWKNRMLTDDNMDEIYLRLSIQRYWMLYQGIRSTPLMPEYCMFNNEYCAYHRVKSNGYRNDGKYYKYLLKKYSLERFIDAFENDGWDVVEYWNEIDNDLLMKWGFRSGDIVKFEHLIKDNL
eukprot:90973_1